MGSARVSSSSFGHVYRPDLDGLRAVAVVPVLLYHLAFPGLPGGFVGVDVFFVLSGFFITSLLLEDLKAGRFRLATFYERRARRILPALFVVLAAVTFASVFVLLPADLAAYGRSLMATLLFASNIYFLRNAGYFDADSDLNPLLHTWSLSVEEQFYIFFPIALWLAFLVARRHLALLLTAALVVSFALGVWATEARPTAAFYLPPTRAWELLIGSVLATGVMPMLGTRWMRDLLGLLGDVTP
jgi:peptidoglycan/LPS O-acetylase OafA/YrhL